MFLGDQLYREVGGEDGVRRIVDRFYDLMEELPEAAAIRAMHPADLTSSRQKLFEFLVGRLGGPPLYVERHGHPRLRRRHMPFAIDSAGAAAWMLCMRGAVDKELGNTPAAEALLGLMGHIAGFMRNTPDTTGE